MTDTFCRYPAGELPTGEPIACGRLTDGSDHCAQHEKAAIWDEAYESGRNDAYDGTGPRPNPYIG